MFLLRLTLVLSIGALATGCDGERKPAAPSPLAGPTVTNLNITGSDAVLTGVPTVYHAVATLSDGSTREVAAVWTSSDLQVASVDNAGRFDGRAHGATNVTASYEGRSASKVVKVVNNYQGAWEGRSVVRVCEDSGIYRDGVFGGIYTDVAWCHVFHGVGSQHPVTLQLAQGGASLTEVTATLGYASDTLTGVVTADGRLSFGGTLNVWDWEGSAVVEKLHITGWETTLIAPGAMTGRWSENLVSLGAAGNVQTEHELVTMIRTPTTQRLPVRKR